MYNAYIFFSPSKEKAQIRSVISLFALQKLGFGAFYPRTINTNSRNNATQK